MEMEYDEMVKEIQNAVSAFERSSGRIVGTIEIRKEEVTRLESRERQFSRFVVIGLEEKHAPMEPII